jgi:dihydropteroate synthase
MSSAQNRIHELLRIAQARERTVMMGVVNATPDSFSDGGLLASPAHAVEYALRLVDEGADIIDVGGESTRPATFASHTPLDVSVELERVLPVIEGIRRARPDVPISIDTYKAEVARHAVAAGAVMINDVSALRADPAMAAITAESGAAVCLMHMPGLPMSLERNPEYGDVVTHVRDHLAERAHAALSAGIASELIVLDPGIGFGKSVSQNLDLLRRLSEIVEIGYPVLIGTSRKSFIGKILGDLPPEERIEGTAATVALAIAGGAAIIRVHDVKIMVRVARISDAVMHGWP